MNVFLILFFARSGASTKGNTMSKPEEMYQCQIANCGCIYNPDKGDRRGKIAKGTSFEDLPEEWKCPVCGASKKAFKALG
jgi:rubredoxin